MRDRVTLWLGVAGALAVLLAVVLTVVHVWPQGDRATPAPRTLETTSFVSKAGGFSVRVPDGLQARRAGDTARFTADDKSLVVSVGPGGPGPLSTASDRLLQRIRGTYSQVKVVGRRTNRVDGRDALTTYGRASNAGKVSLRFVLVVVAAKPRTYALTTFTSADNEPQRVVPVVNELTRSFHVLSR